VVALGPGMTVSFLGTKGGTGTTTMAVNLGAEIRRVTDRTTVLVDLKPAPGDVALFLGLRPRFTLSHVLDKLAWRDVGLLHGLLTPHSCGVDVLAAGEEWGRPAARDAEGIDATLACLRATHHWVIVDAGSTLTPASAVVLQSSDLVVLVANPDVPCLRNLQRLLDAVRLSGVSADQLRVLLNRASDHDALSIAQIESVLGLTLDWRIPSDYRTVSAAITSGTPVHAVRSGDLPRHLEAVARAIGGENYELPASSTSSTTVAPSEDSGASQ
jgi:pilus assembly protein CpaE